MMHSEQLRIKKKGAERREELGNIEVYEGGGGEGGEEEAGEQERNKVRSWKKKIKWN